QACVERELMVLLAVDGPAHAAAVLPDLAAPLLGRLTSQKAVGKEEEVVAADVSLGEEACVGLVGRPGIGGAVILVVGHHRAVPAVAGIVDFRVRRELVVLRQAGVSL